MHLLLSYCKSHIYELHALLAATITFFVMFPLKNPIKVRLERWGDEKASKNERWKKHRKLYRKRCNMMVLLIAFLLAEVLFCIISFVSPLIHFSWYMTWMSGVFALAEYAVYDQIVCREGKKL